MTNTNLQHYSGETGLSYFSQMAVIIMMMFTSAATGDNRCNCFYTWNHVERKDNRSFLEDFTKSITRILLPLSIILTIVLVGLKVPQTLEPTIQATTVEGKTQNIAVGPVASLESIKHLGTNGGGHMGGEFIPSI